MDTITERLTDQIGHWYITHFAVDHVTGTHTVYDQDMQPMGVAWRDTSNATTVLQTGRYHSFSVSSTPDWLSDVLACLRLYERAQERRKPPTTTPITSHAAHRYENVCAAIDQIRGIIARDHAALSRESMEDLSRIAATLTIEKEYLGRARTATVDHTGLAQGATPSPGMESGRFRGPFGH